MDYVRPPEGGDDGAWWRVAIVQYDVEAVIESALDIFRAIELQAKGPLAEEFIALKAKEEGRTPNEIREELLRHTDYAMDRARRELRTITDEAFEQLGTEAFVMVGGFLAAIAMDRMPDFFSPPIRKDAREWAIDHSAGILREWLNVGRPKTQSPMPDVASDFLRLEQLGRELFGGIRDPLEPETLAAVERTVRERLSEPGERAAAQKVLRALRHREIKGKDVQRTKLALRFAANVHGIDGSTRTLQRMYKNAVKATGAG